MITRSLKQFNQSMLLSFRPIYSMRSYNQTIVENQKVLKNTVNNREYYELKNIYGDYDEAKKAKELERKKNISQFQINNLSQNDKNPANFLKVKINSNVYTNEEKKQQVISQYTYKNPQEYTDPVVLKVLPREPLVIVESYTKSVENSVKRLFLPARAVRKQHAYDALSILSNIHTKAAEQISQAISKTISVAKLKEMDLNRLFIHGVIIGRKKKRMGLRYHARGRFGIKHRQTSTIKVMLYEKPVKQLYTEMLEGKTAPVLAYAMRQRMVTENVDYDEIRENQWILTSKGRQQRKLMLKRKVLIQYLQFKAKGFVVDKNLIKQRILEQEATLWAKKYEDKKASQIDSSLEKRMAIFKKNQEITG
ncbi:hypothetical protein ABPG74_008283 [Tetrahymena malaccensis]